MVRDFEEVVVVAAHLARGHAATGVVERAQRAQFLAEGFCCTLAAISSSDRRRRSELDLLADGGHQALVVPRLLDEVAGAAPHGFHRDIEIAPGGHHHYRGVIALAFEAGKQVDALLARRWCRVCS